MKVMKASLIIPLLVLLLLMSAIALPVQAQFRQSFYMRNITFGQTVCPTANLRITDYDGTATTQITVAAGETWCWISDILTDRTVPEGDWILFLWMSDSSSGASSQMNIRMIVVDADGVSNPVVLIDTNQTVSLTVSTEFTYVAVDVATMIDSQRFYVELTRDPSSTNDPRVTTDGAEGATGDSQVSIPTPITTQPGNIFTGIGLAVFTILIIGLAFALIVVGVKLEMPGFWVFSGLLFIAAALIPMDLFFGPSSLLDSWVGNMYFTIMVGLGAIFILLGAFMAVSGET